MKKILIVAIAGSLVAGCQGPRNRSENRLIQENEQRLARLEESVTALNSQVAQLNNRIYEVRTKTGQKTSMTVVPIIKTPPAPAPAVQQAPPAASAGNAPQPAPETAAAPAQPVETAPAVPAAVPAAQTASVSAPATLQTTAPKPAPAPRQPAGRKIDPKAKPGPLPTKARPAQAAAPRAQPASGRIGGTAEPAPTPLVEPGLPPAELPSETIPPVPQGNVTPELPPLNEAPAIPVPVTPVSDLALPPEQPQTAPVPEAAPAQARKNAARPRAAAPVKGEQAAYTAALNAARSGRTAEGIRLFRDFLQKYPHGQYAANAEYWIGECLYSQGKYKDALSEFQNVNNSFPSHHKNADALLKAGITLSKMGDKAGAAEKFRTVIANFPNSEAARRARAMGAN